MLSLIAILFTACKDLDKASEVTATLQNGYWAEIECYQYTRLKKGTEVKGENLLRADMIGVAANFLKFQEGNLLRFYWTDTTMPAHYYSDAHFYYDEKEHSLYNDIKKFDFAPKVKILELSSLYLVLQTGSDSDNFFYKSRFKRIKKADFLQKYSKYEEETP